jgi:hypothetical protein
VELSATYFRVWPIPTKTKQAASIKDLELGGLLPGIKLNTSTTNFAPISQLELTRFKGETWKGFGVIVSADAGASMETPSTPATGGRQ